MSSHSDPLRECDVVIVGAGFAGLGLAIQMKRRGDDSFVLLERAGDVGGTWRDNTYPGVACDVPSHLYCYSFRTKPDWSRMFSPGPEIWEYLRESAREEGLLPHVRLDTDMERCAWDEERERWVVSTSRGEYTGRVLVMAAGHLADEHVPAIPGADTFTGDLFHSARWDHDARLEGRRIGVVGSGASAIQIVPALAPLAEQLVVFQRSAPYVIPRNDRAYTDAEQELYRRDPGEIDALRSDIFWTLEANFAQRRGVQPSLDDARAVALGHLATQVADPALRATLTPDYELGCKRVLISDEYYPTLQRGNVTVEPSALARIEGAAAISAAGVAHELDALVFATGFEATDPPFAHRVVGAGGVTLGARWGQGMQAFASTTVHGFPNMFVINGPNTGLGHNSVVYVVESQIDYILGALDSGRRVLEVRREAEEAYVEQMRRRSAGTVWLEGGCRNWYVDPRTQTLTVVWPDFAHAFRDENARFDPEAYLPEGEREPARHPASVY